MPLYEIREERLYYVNARGHDAALDFHANAPAVEAASADVIEVRLVGNGEADPDDVAPPLSIASVRRGPAGHIQPSPRQGICANLEMASLIWRLAAGG
jgi:hypothetical protein